MARHLTGKREHADQLVAEALERAVTSLDRRPSQMSMLRWLLGMVEAAWLLSMRQRLN